MHPARLLIVAGAALAAASLGTAYLVVPTSARIDGVEGAAWPAAVLVVGIALAVVTGDRREGLVSWAALLVSILAAVATIFAAQKVVDAYAAAGDLTAVGIPASPGAGPWLLLAGTVTVLIGAAFGLSRRLG